MFKMKGSRKMELKNLGINIEEIKEKIENAPSEKKADAILEGVQTIVDAKFAETVKEYQKLQEASQDDVLDYQKLGLRKLTSEENQFVEKLKNIKQAVTGTIDVFLPRTTIEYVFEDIKRNKPLFEYIDFVPAGLVKWIMSEQTGKAVWGALTKTIVDEITSDMEAINIDINSLTAFMIVPMAIIEMGNLWIDRFVREILVESIEEGIEEGIVAGNGKDAPIGMGKNLAGPVVDGVYPSKTPLAVTSFKPSGLSGILDKLTRSGKKVVDTIVIINNPADDAKVFEATHILGSSGYLPADNFKKIVTISSPYVTAGTAIAYAPNTYSFGITKMGVAYSDDYQFLENTRVYAVKGYGNGRLKKNDDAVLLNISGLESLIMTVETVAGA